jgi:nitric oxide reductase subunit B
LARSGACLDVVFPDARVPPRHRDVRGGGALVEERRQFLISRGWIQAVLLVVLFGFFVLGLLAYRTYQAKPPIPQRVVDPQGRTVYTGNEIRRGQKAFLNHGLMEYGSAFGHGAYLGPDYTADYLRRSSDFVRSRYGGPRSDRAGRRTVEDFRTNRYDASIRTSPAARTST